MAALPLANQVRQVYVVSSLKAEGTPSALGELAVKKEQANYLYFQHYGHGGLTSSDRIAIPLIRSITQTPAAKMQDTLHTHTITVGTIPDDYAGKTLKIKVLIHEYVGQGANDYTYRFGLYRVKNGDTAATVAAKLAADLQGSVGLMKGADASNINNYKEKYFTVTVNAAVITISEVDQSANWELGRFPVSQSPVEVFIEGVTTNEGVYDSTWATVVANATEIKVNNVGKKMADLEWFAHGFRGDKVRGVGYPYAITTKYQVDATSNAYDCIDIHYAYQGKGISAQFSEKEITLIVPAGNTTIKAAIVALVGENVIEAPETLEPEE